MPLYLSWARYRLTASVEQIDTLYWDTLESFSNVNTTVTVNKAYSANSAVMNLQGASDALVIGVAGDWRTTLNGVEAVRASGSGTNLVVYDTARFTTDGSLSTIRTGYLNDEVTFTGALRDSALYMGNGADTANFTENTDVAVKAYFGYVRTSAGDLNVYDFRTGKHVNVDASVDTIKIGANAAKVTSTVPTTGAGRQEDYGSLDVSSVSASFNNTTNLASVTFVTNKLQVGEATINAAGNDVAGLGVTFSTYGTKTVTEGAQGTAVNGTLRVYVDDQTSEFYKEYNNVYYGTAGNDTATGESTAAGGAFLFGFDGNDTLSGSGDADSIFGGAGNDTLIGGAGDDTLAGGLGVDKFDVSAGDDTISDINTGGTEAVNFAGTETTNNIARNAPVTDYYFSVTSGYATFEDPDTNTDDLPWNFNDKVLALKNSYSNAVNTVALFSHGDNSYLYYSGSNTGSGDDQVVTLAGGANLNKLTLSATPDGGVSLSTVASATFLIQSLYLSTLTGVVGETSIHVLNQVAYSTHAVFGANLHLPLAQTGYTSATFKVDASQSGVVGYNYVDGNTFTFGTYVNATTVTGGSNGVNYFLAPSYYNNNYAQTIDGNDGDDFILGGAAADTLLGRDGNDLIVGGNGNDSIDGGADDDIIYGNAGNDVLYGGTGNDTFNVWAGTDTITDLASGDALSVDLGATAVANGVSSFTATVATTNNGSATLNAVATGGTIDVSSASGPNANGFALVGGAGNDTLTGGGKADTITGGAGVDTLTGNAGNDVFIIAAGADHASGETIEGGTGNDTIRFTSTTTNDKLTLLVGVTDTGNAITVVISDAAGDTTGTTALDVDASGLVDTLAVTLTGNDGDNVLRGNATADAISGGKGDDTIIGMGGADTLTGGAGNDILVADDADTVVDGGDGADTMQLAVNAGFAANELAKVESVELASGVSVTVNYADVTDQDNIARVTGVNDGSVEKLIVVGASAGAVTLDYSAANLTLTDVLLEVNGGNADEIITGTAGADDIDGGAGNDTITGGASADVIDVGVDTSADVVVFSSGLGTSDSDRITNFDAILDAVRFDFVLDGDGSNFNGNASVVDANDDIGSTQYREYATYSGFFDQTALVYNFTTGIGGDFASMTQAEIVTAIESALEDTSTVSGKGILSGVTGAQVVAGSAEMDVIVAITDGTNNVALVRYQEGVASEADYAGELTLVGVLSSVTASALSEANFIA